MLSTYQLTLKPTICLTREGTTLRLRSVSTQLTFPDVSPLAAALRTTAPRRETLLVARLPTPQGFRRLGSRP